ncbi:MAG: radical SAM protein [Candidatus Omnitrophota bacterium]
MRIALVFPNYGHKVFSENLKFVDEEFCLAPPIILAYIAAILERHGHEVMLLDIRALALTKEEALKKIREFNPEMLGFRAETYHFYDALALIKYLKANLKIPVFTGGVNMTLYPRETIEHEEIDYGIIGEAIESLPKMIRALGRREQLKGIPGVVYKSKTGGIIINPASNELADFNEYPFPARHLLPNEKYYSFISQRKNFTLMLKSTGCPFKCSFCAIPNAYRFRSPQSVIKEIEVCYNDFNIREIDFFDAVFFMPRESVRELFSLLKERKLDLEWSCRSRVDIVDEVILKEAAEAGCRQIYFGIESVDQNVLNSINKNVSPDMVKRTINLSRDYGIKTMGFFMVGNEKDTAESVRKSIKFAKDLKLDFVQVCKTIAKPGTELHKQVNAATGIDFWQRHLQQAPLTERLPAPWSSLTEEKKTSLTKEFYFRFYFRPIIIWKILLRLKSFSEFKRYCRAALKFLRFL